jgi:hypothetical protein
VSRQRRRAHPEIASKRVSRNGMSATDPLFVSLVTVGVVVVVSTGVVVVSTGGSWSRRRRRGRPPTSWSEAGRGLGRRRRGLDRRVWSRTRSEAVVAGGSVSTGGVVVSTGGVVVSTGGVVVSTGGVVVSTGGVVVSTGGVVVSAGGVVVSVGSGLGVSDGGRTDASLGAGSADGAGSAPARVGGSLWVPVTATGAAEARRLGRHR